MHWVVYNPDAIIASIPISAAFLQLFHFCKLCAKLFQSAQYEHMHLDIL